MQTPTPSTTTLPWRHAALFLLPAVLAACGGGGGSASDTPAPQAISPTSGDAGCTSAEFQAVAMARINYHRARGASCPVPNSNGAVAFYPATTPLTWNSKLAQAAVGHSTDMQVNNFHDHVSSDGRIVSDRVNATGYAWSSIGENIAAGYPSVNVVVDAWVGHEGHCQNVMNANFTEVGMACAAGTGANTFSNYWTMDLARPL